jgi:glycosyltransferase involved in cell wall biosynthesis
VDPAARDTLESVLRDRPEGTPTLVDGLVLSAGSEVVAAAADRLRLVVLSHMPLGHADPAASPGEGAALARAAGVVATSQWTRDWLLAAYGLPAERVHVVEPGVTPAPVAPGTVAGGELLCVAAVTPGKGHDLLVAALADVAEPAWRCTCVGAVDVDPGFAAEVRRAADEHGLGDRIAFPGPLVAADLERAYAAADVLVLPSRAETYGMVVTEALAHGLPVLTADVGGVAEALGRGSDGTRPGLLVPAGDAGALARALRDWLGEPGLRERLRRAARDRRVSLTGWHEASGTLSEVLSTILSEPPGRPIRMGS